MAYSAEVIQRARTRLAQAKEDRESENRQHLAVAYDRVPRIREIDMLLRRSMALAAQAVFTGGGDAVQAMEQVKNKNIALQQERAALAAEHFEEGYLDDSPICDKCGGRGYIGSTMCECLTELCRQEQKKELTLLSSGRESFSQFRLDYYPETVDPVYKASPKMVMERNFQICRKFAMNFGPGAGNLLFTGKTGLGKTFLSACIARTVAERGCSVVYESSAHLFSKLEKARFNPDPEAIRESRKFVECDLLILDDLGTEMPGQFVTAALYSLLNDRILACKSMVVSTNLTVDEIERRYTPQIASRLHGGFKMLSFVGNDIRVMRNKEQ